jgi:hypothetical protein
LRIDAASPLQEFVAPKRLKSIASERNHAGDGPLRGVRCNLPSASAQQSRSSFLGEPVPRKKVDKFVRRPTFLRKGLDGVCRHHQVLIVSPRDSIAILGDNARQKEIFISKGPVDFVAKDRRTQVDEILATGSWTI